MRINHNLMAMNAKRYLTTTGSLQGKSLEKISSGLRINTAADDAAGLAISEKMRAQIKGLEQSSRNAQDGISLIQTAEGALQESHSILQRMRELAVQASNGTNDDADRADMQKEVTQLKSELDRISTDVEFNKKKILNGSMGKETNNYVADGFIQQDIVAVGDSLKTGTYTLTETGGTDTETITVNTAVTNMDANDISFNGTPQLSYGTYELKVTRFDGTTADLELIGPNGEVTKKDGQAIGAADVMMGGFDFDFDTHAITSVGTVKFDLTRDGMTFTLTGDATGSTGAIASYKGETLSVGGFEFELKTNTLSGNNATTFDLDDNSVQFQIGANATQSIKLGINEMSSKKLGVDAIDISSTQGAEAAITTISTAIEKVSGERSKLGAVQNRLEHTIKNLDTSAENLQASESRIRDVDIAKEMMNYTKLNILQQAAQSMLAQANQAPQGVLQLLR